MIQSGMASQFPAEFGLSVKFEPREDGGLTATCDIIPNLYLSGSDADAVRADVIPALEAVLSAMYERPMQVIALPRPDEALAEQVPMPALIGGSQIYKGVPAH
jgi:hypothetical protein